MRLQAIYGQRLQLRAHHDRFRSERVFQSTHEGRASYSQRKAGWFKDSTPNTSHHVAQDGSSLPSSAPCSTIRHVPRSRHLISIPTETPLQKRLRWDYPMPPSRPARYHTTRSTLILLQNHSLKNNFQQT